MTERGRQLAIKDKGARFRVVVAMIGVVLLSACAPKVQVSQRYFWPPSEGAEKIEYLNFYVSDEDLLRGVNRWFEEVFLGKRPPKRLIFQPYSVASDAQGRIIVGDFSKSSLLVLDRKKHAFRDLPGLKGAPQKVLVDGAGEIWVLVANNPSVYRYSADEKPLRELPLPGISRAASLAVDAERQRLYLTDTPSHRVCIYDFQGNSLGAFGGRGRDPGQFNFPTDLDLDREGNLYVVDAMNARVQVFSPEGQYIRAFGERGTASGAFASPKGIAVSPSGLVYVTDALQNKVIIFSAKGEYLFTFGGSEFFDGKNVRPGGLYFPSGIDVDANETIFVADFFNGMVHEFQYLTSDYLAKHPIRSTERYLPHEEDYGKGSRAGSGPINEAPVMKGVTPLSPLLQ